MNIISRILSWFKRKDNFSSAEPVKVPSQGFDSYFAGNKKSEIGTKVGGNSLAQERGLVPDTHGLSQDEEKSNEPVKETKSESGPKPHASKIKRGMSVKINGNDGVVTAVIGDKIYVQEGISKNPQIKSLLTSGRHWVYDAGAGVWTVKV